MEDRELAAEFGFIDSIDDPVFDEEEIRKRLNQRAQQVKVGWMASKNTICWTKSVMWP